MDKKPTREVLPEEIEFNKETGKWALQGGYMSLEFKQWIDKKGILPEVEQFYARQRAQGPFKRSGINLSFKGLVSVEGHPEFVEGEEINCVLLGNEHCVFKFNLIGEELDDSLIDEESEESVSGFLSTL